jgi:hypothetical protein
MAQQLLGLSFRIPVAATVSTPVTGFPATNAPLLPLQWRRTTRWNGPHLQIDFGGTTTLDGVFLHHGNFGTVNFAASSDGSSWTNLYATNQAFGLDERVEPPPRRKQWFPASGWQAPFAHRYLRVLPATPYAGATYWELGAVAFPVVESMTRNWGVPFEWTPTEPVTRVAYAGGGAEYHVEGPTLLRYRLQGGPWHRDALPQLRRLRALGQGGAVFLWENRGDLTHAYLLRRAADVAFGERQVVFDAPFEFEECI